MCCEKVFLSHYRFIGSIIWQYNSWSFIFILSCVHWLGEKLSYFTFERTFSGNMFPISYYTYNLDWQFDIPALSNVEDWMIRILSFPDDTSNHLNCKYRNFWYSFDVLLRRDIKWIMNALTTKVYTRLISLKYFHFLLSTW